MFTLVGLSSKQVFLLQVNGLLVVVAVLADLYGEWKFRARHGAVTQLVELDNVHLASLLRALAEDEGLSVHIGTFRLRQLLFFLGPLFKMALLVPSEMEVETREWLAGLDLKNP